jgi:dTDP-4-amino-4,6-dideoxygalactose transaminase
MINDVFQPWPAYSEEEANAVHDVLLSNKVNYWTGDEGRQFEQEFSEWAGTQHAIALANGTVALEFALKAIGINEGDEVIVTPRTFIASVSCVVNTGAKPVFVDVDYESGNLSAETIGKAITSLTKAVICVHLAGWPCEMDPIMELANEHGFYVIEDCAQAHGAEYKGRKVGAIGHIGAWSFCNDKIMTTGGEGGMITTNDKVLCHRIWSLKDHGKSLYAVEKSLESPPYQFDWLHESFGTNGRMLGLQAAIGRIQLKRMSEWHSARKRNAESIFNVCDRFPEAIFVPRVPDLIEHAYYKCYIYVRPGGLKKRWSRARIIEKIIDCGVPCYFGSCSEVYLEKAFDGTGFRPKERLPVAKELGETALMFLVHPTLTKKEIELTCSVINDVFSLAKV